MAPRTVQLADFEKVQGLHCEHAELDPVSILLHESLLHALFLSSVRLEALRVVWVGEKDLGQWQSNEVLIHRSYV